MIPRVVDNRRYIILIYYINSSFKFWSLSKAHRMQTNFFLNNAMLVIRLGNFGELFLSCPGLAKSSNYGYPLPQSLI